MPGQEPRQAMLDAGWRAARGEGRQTGRCDRCGHPVALRSGSGSRGGASRRCFSCYRNQVPQGRPAGSGGPAGGRVSRFPTLPLGGRPQDRNGVLDYLRRTPLAVPVADRPLVLEQLPRAWWPFVRWA